MPFAHQRHFKAHSSKATTTTLIPKREPQGPYCCTVATVLATLSSCPALPCPTQPSLAHTSQYLSKPFPYALAAVHAPRARPQPAEVKSLAHCTAHARASPCNSLANAAPKIKEASKQQNLSLARNLCLSDDRPNQTPVCKTCSSTPPNPVTVAPLPYELLLSLV